MKRHGGGSFSQQEQFPHPFTLLRISSCNFFLSSSFWDRRSAGGSDEVLLLFRILLFWVFHRSAYRLPGMLRRDAWSPRSATLPCGEGDERADMDIGQLDRPTPPGRERNITKPVGR